MGAGFDQIAELPVQHRFQGEITSQPVIGGAVVLGVVGTDLFTAITAAKLVPSGDINSLQFVQCVAE